MHTFNGQKLRALRELHNLSRPKLADLVGVHFMTVRDWEIGGRRYNTPSRKNLNALAGALGVPVEAFFEAQPDAAVASDVGGFAEPHAPRPTSEEAVR